MFYSSFLTTILRSGSSQANNTLAFAYESIGAESTYGQSSPRSTACICMLTLTGDNIPCHIIFRMQQGQNNFMAQFSDTYYNSLFY